MPVRLKQHFQRIGHVQNAEPSRGIEQIDADRLAGALLDERTRRRMACAARGVVADLLGSLAQRLRAEGEEVGRDELIVDQLWWFLGKPVADDFAQPFLANVRVVPEQVNGGRIERYHWRPG